MALYSVVAPLFLLLLNQDLPFKKNKKLTTLLNPTLFKPFVFEITTNLDHI